MAKKNSRLRKWRQVKNKLERNGLSPAAAIHKADDLTGLKVGHVAAVAERFLAEKALAEMEKAGNKNPEAEPEEEVGG